MSIVQNLMLKRLVIFCKCVVSKVSCLGLSMFKSRPRLDFLLKISVFEHQCLVLVSKILAETPALIAILIELWSNHEQKST